MIRFFLGCDSKSCRWMLCRFFIKTLGRKINYTNPGCANGQFPGWASRQWGVKAINTSHIAWTNNQRSIDFVFSVICWLMYVWMCVFFVYVYVCTCVYVYVYVCVRVYVCVCVCVCVCAGDEATKDEYVSIAQFFENKKQYVNAGRFWLRAEEYPKVRELVVKWVFDFLHGGVVLLSISFGKSPYPSFSTIVFVHRPWSSSSVHQVMTKRLPLIWLSKPWVGLVRWKLDIF